MTQDFKIAATPRKQVGTRAAQRLRAEGRVPAILYGHKETPTNLAVDEKQLRLVLRDHAHGLLDLDMGDKTESAVIKDLQYDTFGIGILHVDFFRIARGERIIVDVAIDLKGTAPGISQGGVLDFEIHSLKIECPAENIVERLSLPIDKLKIGEALHAKDVKLPAGMTLKSDPELIVVKVAVKAGDEDAAAAAVAEPELIRKEKAAAEDDKEAKDKK